MKKSRVLIASGATICALVALLFFGGFSLFQSHPKQTVERLLKIADVQINGSRPWDIQVHDESFYPIVLGNGSLGLGQTYMQGLWDCDALDECICRIVRANLQTQVTSWPVLWGLVKAKLFNLQNKQRSLDVIEQHYQLGNDLYQRMLDPTMTYSCGYWKNAQTLHEAQEAKYDLICRKLYLKPGMRVLDIGCGWGGFAHFAAKNYGAQVVGVTLSENQAEYARQICQGLPVEIRVQDYRDVDEPFDRIIEIGMFEHVGVKNYREFMEVVHRNLTDDGLFMLHTIGSNTSTMTTDPWIDTYIFPNGHLPSIAQIGESIETLFVMEDWHNFGPDYDRTLCNWYANFNNQWNVLAPNYNPTFYRMWRYYLLSCAGSFRARHLQLWQVVLSKNGIPGGYVPVR